MKKLIIIGLAFMLSFQSFAQTQTIYGKNYKAYYTERDYRDFGYRDGDSSDYQNLGQEQKRLYQVDTTKKDKDSFTYNNVYFINYGVTFAKRQNFDTPYNKEILKISKEVKARADEFYTKTYEHTASDLYYEEFYDWLSDVFPRIDKALKNKFDYLARWTSKAKTEDQRRKVMNKITDSVYTMHLVGMLFAIDDIVAKMDRETYIQINKDITDYQKMLLTKETYEEGKAHIVRFMEYWCSEVTDIINRHTHMSTMFETHKKYRKEMWTSYELISSTVSLNGNCDVLVNTNSGAVGSIGRSGLALELTQGEILDFRTIMYILVHEMAHSIDYYNTTFHGVVEEDVINLGMNLYKETKDTLYNSNPIENIAGYFEHRIDSKLAEKEKEYGIESIIENSKELSKEQEDYIDAHPFRIKATKLKQY